MPNELHDLSVGRVSLVKRAAVRDPTDKSESRKFLVWKADEDTTGRTDMADDTITVEEHEAALAKREQELEAQHKEEIEKLEAKKGKPGTEDDADGTERGGATDKPDTTKADINKDELTPEVRALLAKQEEDISFLRKRVESSEEIAKAEREQRLDREFVAKAERLSLIAQDPNELGPVLKRASQALSKEDYEYLEGRFTAANEQIAKGDLFREAGSGIAASGAPGDAFEALQRKAEEISKADPNISTEEAFEKAVLSDRNLQAQYLAEVRPGG